MQIPIAVIAGILCISDPLSAPEQGDARPQEKALTARQILGSMMTTYAKCRSYRDSGLIEARSPRSGRMTRATFSTAYLRPDRFRLELRHPFSEEDKHILHFDRDGLRVSVDGYTMALRWSDLPAPHQSALSGVASLRSAAVAYGVPALLMADRTDGSYLTTLVNPARLDDSSVDGIDCFCLEGKTSVGSSVRIWVDKKTYLLRRIDERGLNHEEDAGSLLPARSSVIIRPDIGIEVTDAELAFKPPAPGSRHSPLDGDGGDANAGGGAKSESQDPRESQDVADQILKRMARTYANCKTYQDSGVVETVYISSRKTYSERQPFRTAFVRHDRFRFEFSEEGDDGSRYIVWAKGNDVRTWWDLSQELEIESSLGLALAGATGISGGSAHTIPALLLPGEVGGLSLTSVTEAKRISDDTLGDVKCYRIVGKYADDPIAIWIDMATYLVRRIDSRSVFPDFKTKETTIYSPAVDEKINDALLGFERTQEKARRSLPELEP